MNHEVRLKYCRICQNKSFDFQKGLVCRLTTAKPDFEGKCTNYIENRIERKNYETNLFYETADKISLTESNTYSTNKFLIRIVQHFLPKELNVVKVDIDQFIGGPIITLILLVLAINFVPATFPLFVTILTIITLLYFLIIRVWKETGKESTVIFNISRNGLTRNKRTIPWKDVTLITVHSKVNFSKPTSSLSLRLQLLSEPEPVNIPINRSYGAIVILTIVEAYRKKSFSSHHGSP